MGTNELNQGSASRAPAGALQRVLAGGEQQADRGYHQRQEGSPARDPPGPGVQFVTAVRNLVATGTAEVAPNPASSTSTATAMLPRKAANQAWVGGFFPVPCSAVPVLPNTGVPGRFAEVAVPEVTTARIASRSPLATAAGSGWLTGEAPGVRWGWCQVPESAAAAMAAMARGLVRTVPWPMAEDA